MWNYFFFDLQKETANIQHEGVEKHKQSVRAKLEQEMQNRINENVAASVVGCSLYIFSNECEQWFKVNCAALLFFFMKINNKPANTAAVVNIRLNVGHCVRSIRLYNEYNDTKQLWYSGHQIMQLRLKRLCLTAIWSKSLIKSWDEIRLALSSLCHSVSSNVLTFQYTKAAVNDILYFNSFDS